MKKIIVLLFSVILLVSLIPQIAFAEEQNNTFKLSNQKHRFENYWEIGSFYLLESVSYTDYEDGTGETAEVLLSKAGQPYLTGDEEDEPTVLNLTEIAKEAGNYDSGNIAPYSGILSDGHAFYAVVNVSNKPTEDYVGDFENIIVRADMDNLSYRIFNMKGHRGSMIELVKLYKGNVYFSVNRDKLYRLGSDGKITKIASSLGIMFQSQSDSRSKFVYGYKPNGYSGTLKVFDLAKKQTLKKISGVRGYSVDAGKLYYAKKENSMLKVYESKAGGSSPKIVCKLKSKSGVESSITRVVGKYVYYSSIDANNDFARSYFRYNRNTKKIAKISYIEYAEATADYADGYAEIEEYYIDLLAEDGDGEEE